MRTVYQARHRRITELLGRNFADVLEPIPSAAGLHLSAIYRAGTADDILAATRRALSTGFFLYALSQFSVGTAQPALLIGYGAIPLERIDEGLQRLRASIRP